MNGRHACLMLSLPRPHFYESRLFSLSQEFPGGPGRRTSGQLQPPRGPRAPSPTVQRRPRWISSFSIGSHHGWTRLSHRPGPSVSAAPWGASAWGAAWSLRVPQRDTPKNLGHWPTNASQLSKTPKGSTCWRPPLHPQLRNDPAHPERPDPGSKGQDVRAVLLS